MDDFVKLVSTFVSALSLIMALVLMISIVHRKAQSGWVHTLMMGGMFSFAVIYTMSDPIPIEVGQYDMRFVLVGCAIALLGPTVGTMAFVTALAYGYGIGGIGVVLGMSAIMFTFIGGVIWRVFVMARNIVNWIKALLLGILISSNGLGILVGPQETWMRLLVHLVLYIFVSGILGAFVLHNLIRGELSFLTEAETSRTNASTDHLTGLLNRRGFDLAYPILSKINSTAGHGWGMTYFDIDKFKDINDTHGHAVGDDILQHITRRVATNLRPNDVFARLGGDEFAIVLSNIDAREAQRVADRCRTMVEGGEFEHDGEILNLSISVGAIWTFDQIEMDRILEEADAALYAAKAASRNKVVFKSNLNLPPFSTAA